MTSRFNNFVLAGLASLALGGAALAGGTHEPGSLLVFPSFDNTRGTYTYLTVTNTSDDQDNGTVKVEYVYLNRWNCQEFNRTRTLTPNDVLTVVTKLDNPNCVEGYCYVFAKHKTTGAAIKFDHLIGTARFVGCDPTDDYEVQPFVYKAAAGLAEGAVTDLNSNGLRDMDGSEYEQVADRLLFPRFNAQDDTDSADLVLINLTGGAQFTAVVDFLIYNDNEEVFSAQTSFQCWKSCHLSHISNAFDEWFLDSTNNASGEYMLGGEYGWFRVNGLIANSTAASFANPAILAVLIEKKSGDAPGNNGEIGGGTGAVLPFSEGVQANGSLLSLSIFGN